MRPELRLYAPCEDEPVWIGGDPELAWFPVDEGVSVRRGDFLWLDGSDVSATVKPASELALHIEEPYDWEELQRRFAALFAGIACDDSPVGECEWLPVATAGVYQVRSDCGRAMVGSLVGMGISPDGTVLRDRRVQLVRAEDRAIGRVRYLNQKAQPRLSVRIDSQALRRIVHLEAA